MGDGAMCHYCRRYACICEHPEERNKERLTAENEALRAQVARLTEILQEIDGCEDCDGSEHLIAGVPAASDSLEWLERQRKLAAADAWDKVARTCREYVAAHNPEVYATRGKVEPGYVEAQNDMADIAEDRAAQLRKEAGCE